jgi:hypothetical protein
MIRTKPTNGLPTKRQNGGNTFAFIIRYRQANVSVPYIGRNKSSHTPSNPSVLQLLLFSTIVYRPLIHNKRDHIEYAHVPKELREQIAQYKKTSTNLQPRIYHIKRDINGVAHNSAHQAIKQSQYVSISSCSNSAHVQGNFPLVLTL